MWGDQALHCSGSLVDVQVLIVILEAFWSIDSGIMAPSQYLSLFFG